MTRHDDFVITCINQAVVDKAMAAARSMIVRTTQRLQAVITVPEDDRGRDPVRRALVDAFKVAPGLLSGTQVRAIKTNFELLAQAVKRARALCVSAADPECARSGEIGHCAYAHVGADGSPTCYLCPSFFHETPTHQARHIVHELAHARLGVGHRGGLFASFEHCPDLRLRSFDDAIFNAYAYDAFADCVSSLP